MLRPDDIRTYVVNLRRRPDRRRRMEAILPDRLDVTYTSDWAGPFDGHEIDRETLDRAGIRLFPWEIDSDNMWWSRPLKLGQIGCTLAHWTCWQHAYVTGTEHNVLVLEDDVVLADDFLDHLLVGIERLDGRRFDLLYLGRYPLEPGTPAGPGIVMPGFSYCTFAYLLTRDALPIVMATELTQAVVPIDEFLPSMYVDHPRQDLRERFPKQLVALAFDPPLVRQLPTAVAGSDTEDSAFADWLSPPDLEASLPGTLASPQTGLSPAGCRDLALGYVTSAPFAFMASELLDARGPRLRRRWPPTWHCTSRPPAARG